MIEVFDELEQGTGPLVRVMLADDGSPCGAVGQMRVDAPPDRVAAVFRDVNHFAERVHMIHRARRDGDRVELQLRFRVALFSTKFTITTEVAREDDRSLHLRYVSGEPRDLNLRFAVEPLEDGAATMVRVAVSYDILSLGWLVKFFLKHHPEIQFGVYPGTALTLLESLRRAAEEARR